MVEKIFDWLPCLVNLRYYLLASLLNNTFKMATQTRFAEISFEEIKDKGFYKTQNMPQNVALNFLKVSDFQIYSNLTNFYSDIK